MMDFSKYTLPNGLITEHSVEYIDHNDMIYETDNPHLWYGQYRMLYLYLPRTNSSVPSDKLYSKFLRDCQIVPGLHARYPISYVNSEYFNSISFDEHNGIAFTSIAVNNFRALEEIIEYGDDNGWCFYEKKPYISPFRNLLNPIKVFKLIRTIVSIFKLAKKTKRWGGSSAIDKLIFADETAVLLSRIRLPKDIAFLKIVSPKYKPSKIGLLHLFITSLSTIKKQKRSGVNMLYFRLISFELIGYNPLWVRYIRYQFKKKVDPVANAVRFYPPGHPFIKAIYEVENE